MADRRSRQAFGNPKPAPFRGRVTAVLGPTNTGKTHFAIERMLAHRSGMIGLPLRLLAREVFDKIVRLKGAADVALITGEERIVPKFPRFYVCTVEAMPVDIPVAFLAVDEIQLATDLERGHVFTDRLLHACGEEETMWLGALTMKGAITRVAPATHFITRPRFSDLAYTGPKNLSRLPRRSAIVAFSVEDVYGLAETVRSQRGGAAVVLGALSPRTRNAQVALYQSGEVDFLIATDAIGMGINMDVDHVAFAARDKFDGVTVRPLKPEEIGQIAGRAGRFMNDGTFGVTGDTDPFDAELVAQIENHRYDPVKVLQWRNSDLDFSSLDALLFSLDTLPPARGLIKARPVSDHWTLQSLSRDDDIRDVIRAPAAVLLMRHLRDEEQLALVLDDSGAVSLGSEHVGKLDGFRFAPDPRAEGIHGRTLRAAALKGLEGEIAARARALAAATDDAIHLSEHAQLGWSGAVVAKLAPGPHKLTPTVQLIADDLLKGELRESVQARLETWVAAHIAHVLDPLTALRDAAESKTLSDGTTLPGPARGLAFQLAENLGQLERENSALPLDLRTAAHALRPFGVRVGRRSIFLPRLIKPAPSALAALLWAVHARLTHIPPPPQPGLTSFALDADNGSEAGDAFLAAAFYRRLGTRAVRLDILERIESVLVEAAQLSKNAADTMTVLVSLLGCAKEDVTAIAAALGWRQIMRVQKGAEPSEPIPVWQRARPHGRGRKRSSATQAVPD